MSKPIATNKKAFHNFFLQDKLECGIELVGPEVKSIRMGGLNFKDSFVRVDDGQIYVYNLHINPYEQTGSFKVEADRKRRLLLHASEIKKIAAKMGEKGLTVVPTKVYMNKRGLVKMEIALAKGKLMYDKRKDIKKRDTDREMARVMRHNR